jgi:hypothetical protein
MESVSIEVGTFAVNVTPTGVQIFEQSEAPTKSPGAAGWSAPACPSSTEGPLISMNKDSIGVSFNQGDDSKRSRLLISKSIASLEFGGSLISLDGKKILLMIGDSQKQGLKIDATGLSLLKSGQWKPIADGESFGGNIKTTEIPSPMTVPPEQPITKVNTLEQRWLDALESEAKKSAEKVAELRKKTMTEVEEAIKARNERLAREGE